jgi:hypothetical protein
MVWGPNGCDPLEPRIDPGTPYHEGTEAMASMTIKQFIVKHNVTMTCVQVDANPHIADDADWARTASHYLCTLRHGRRTMKVHYSMGSAHTEEPKVAEVLDSLASDYPATNVTFETWCDDYGYDTDSIKALKTFRACRRVGAQLAKWLGEDLLAELLECERM